MSGIRVKPGTTGAEQLQFTQRAQGLGLAVKGGVIDPASAQNVKGGLPALQALLDKDGALDGAGLAQLRQNKGFVASMLGRDLPISEKRSRDVRGLAMDLKGAAAQVDKTEREIRFKSSIDNPVLLEVNKKLEAVVQKFNTLIGEHEAPLAQVDPKAARELAEGIGTLARSMSSYSAVLSQFRSAVLSAQGDGFWQRAQINAITNNLFAAIDGNRQLQTLADIFTAPAPGTVAGSAAAQSLGRDLDAWRA